MSAAADDALTANPFAIARLLLASRVRSFGGAHQAAGLDREAARRAEAWGAWLDRAQAAGSGAADVMASVPRATFGLTVWGEAAALDGLLGFAGIGEVERFRFASLAAQAIVTGAWLVEDDAGFEGGFVLGPLSAAAVLAILPGDGVARALGILDELGLEMADELRRTVNPGGEATELAAFVEGDALARLDRAWRGATGAGLPASIEALAAEASGPLSLLLKAGERGITGVGVRVPIAAASSLVRALAVVRASAGDDERLAATLGAVGVERPDVIDVVKRAEALELRVHCLADVE